MREDCAVHVQEVFAHDVEPVEVAVEDERLVAFFAFVEVEQPRERFRISVQPARDPQRICLQRLPARRATARRTGSRADSSGRGRQPSSAPPHDEPWPAVQP
jgi:hypothetical protein